MKLSKIKVLALAALMCCPALAMGAECEIGMGIVPISEGENVPPRVARQLESKLKMALTHVGVAAGDYDCQFFLTGRFDHAYSQEAGGVGGRVMVKTNLQLAICDGIGQKVYATEIFPLKGVGASDVQALIRALGSLNASNKLFATFVETGKAKIIDYFNKNYPTYLSKAQKALKARNYEEALYWATAVPECCEGYAQASAMADNIYTDKVNYDGAMLLAQAEGEWAQNPTDAGAAAAYSYLSQIDPSAACYPQAKALGSKMAAVVKENYDFETKEKYRNAVNLEKQRIQAAKEVAVAWAQNQPKTVVHYNWIW